MNQLIRAEDTPTHKLVVRLDDGTFRAFYLTEEEAVWVARNINTVEPNLVLPRSIDPNAPSFYPKRGAWMERMSQAEIATRRARYADKARASVSVGGSEAAEAAKREKSSRIRAWVKGHPGDFERMQHEAEDRLRNGKGMFNSASRGVRRNLVRFEAYRAVDDLLSKQ